MSIRVTNMQTTSTMLDYITQAQTTYNTSSQQAASGVKITKPSDNAFDAVSILDANKQLNQLSGYTNNIKLANNELAVTDDAFSSMTKTLQNINDLATEAANGTNGQSSLNDIKTQVDQLIQSMVSLGNTQYNGTYIFSGTATATEPFTYDSATGTVTYNGNTGSRTTQISDGVDETINVNGSSLLGNSTSGIFKALTDLSTALGAGDKAAITASLDQIQNGSDNVSVYQTKMAAVVNRLDLTSASISTSTTQLKEYRSGMQDVDLTEAATQMAAAQVALNATTAITAQIIKGTSLLDYL